MILKPYITLLWRYKLIHCPFTITQICKFPYWNTAWKDWFDWNCTIILIIIVLCLIYVVPNYDQESVVRINTYQHFLFSLAISSTVLLSIILTFSKNIPRSIFYDYREPFFWYWRKSSQLQGKCKVASYSYLWWLSLLLQGRQKYGLIIVSSVC